MRQCESLRAGVARRRVRLACSRAELARPHTLSLVPTTPHYRTRVEWGLEYRVRDLPVTERGRALSQRMLRRLSSLSLAASAMCLAPKLSTATGSSIHSLAGTKHDGSSLPLSSLEGKAALIVNVASR